jgi:hypothetical protein
MASSHPPATALLSMFAPAAWRGSAYAIQIISISRQIRFVEWIVEVRHFLWQSATSVQKASN